MHVKYTNNVDNIDQDMAMVASGVGRSGHGLTKISEGPGYKLALGPKLPYEYLDQ